ncbi:MAG TPA: hypothetical protein VMW24_24230 [Sedimentisphaerales bacterium]|nr:hypothetical protein [Sedimentisphaerales bacterium]
MKKRKPSLSELRSDLEQLSRDVGYTSGRAAREGEKIAPERRDWWVCEFKRIRAAVDAAREGQG